MHKNYLLTFIFACVFLFGYNQSINENSTSSKVYYFGFKNYNKIDIEYVTNIISIDNLDKDSVKAYGSLEAIKTLTVHYPFLEIQVYTSPGNKQVPYLKNWKEIQQQKSWNYYPTYGAYDTIMQQFQSGYPNLCKLINIGTLSSGRKLLAVKISDSVNQKDPEPEFFYTSTMHGDETGGYILMLHLIDYLLTNYGVDQRITNLINNTEIYINPLANPDGLYQYNNNNISGATRTNLNGVDLNRNFPDPAGNTLPFPIQQETQYFMDFADSQRLVMSANIHGGAEVCNYPWDTWYRLHADDLWWQYVCNEYADTAQANSPTGYMEDFGGTGITNGFQWYSTHGNRQDYMNYYHHCREFTLELSDIKINPESQLINLWNYNYKSLLNYIEQVTFGLHGFITDSITGKPLAAKVFIAGHDKDSSHVYSDLPHGDYHRPLHQGNYNVTFSASGYKPKTISVQITNRNTTNLNVQLVPKGIGIKEPDISIISIFPNPFHDKISINVNDKSTTTVKLYDITGKLINEKLLTSDGELNTTDLSEGLYLLTIHNKEFTITRKVIKKQNPTSK
jgi:hypothetical protein